MLLAVCSTCLRFKEKMKNKQNLTNEVKSNLLTEQRLHKLKSQAFFRLLSDDNEEVEILSFDCQKNLALPKLPDQACYFSQQINFYNFTVVYGNSKSPLNPTTVSAYVCTELNAPKDSNLIASAVYDRVCNMQLKDSTKIVRLFSDGCGGQNKNVAMMTMLSSWLLKKAPQIVKSVEIIFPMVGHSFLPPDRVFGLIEKKVRKMPVVVKPEEYEAMISEYATVKKIGEWPLLDWKAEAKKYVKLPGSWHFAFNKSKRFILQRDGNNNISIRGEVTYRTDLGVEKGVCKRGHSSSKINPTIMQTGRQLKGDKSSISRLLTSHYGDNWVNDPNLIFYKNVFDGNQPENQNEEEVNDEECTLAVETDLIL